MATRRALVFDNDSAFFTLIKSSLGAYGFEVQVADPRPDNIQKIKVLKPEVAFIAVDAPDKVGYTLCSKAKKAVGSRIPIVLATATLSLDDLALHAKLKMHADAYLDKRSISRDELLHKLDELIRLGPRIGPLPPEDNGDLGPSKDVKQIPVMENKSDLSEGSIAKVYEASDPANQEELTSNEPASISESLEETIESEGDTNYAVSSQTYGMRDQTVKNDANGYNDLDGRLAKQESEINHLRQQLEEARRDARSSPFSSDFLSLREQIIQKDSEIIHLTEKLHDSNREILTGKNKLRQFAKRKAELKMEIRQGLKREKELTAILQVKQHEITSAQKALKALKHKATKEAKQAKDTLVQEQQTHEQTRQHFESKIAELQDQHDAAIKQVELEKQLALESLQKQIQEQLAKAEENHQQALNTLENKYAAQIAQIQDEKNAEIEALKQKAIKEAKQAKDTLAQEQQTHEQTRQHFKSKIAELQDQHDTAIKQVELEKQLALEPLQKQIQEQLAKAEENHQQALNTLENKYAAQIAQIQDEIKDVEEQRLAQLRAAEKKYKAILLKVEETRKQELQALKKKYTSQIAQLQEEKNVEIEELAENVIPAFSLDTD